MKSRYKIILASGSEARKNMLESAGLEIEVIPADVDEAVLREHLIHEGTAVSEIAEMLAQYKAQTVAQSYPEALVIGSDQLLVLGHEIFEKPSDIREARLTLQRLRGQTHELISAAAIVLGSDVLWRGADVARLTMRDFGNQFLEDYLEAEGDVVLTSVGAYRIEGLGINLFDRVDGDYFTILGLPLMALLAVLRTGQVLPS